MGEGAPVISDGGGGFCYFNGFHFRITFNKGMIFPHHKSIITYKLADVPALRTGVQIVRNLL